MSTCAECNGTGRVPDPGYKGSTIICVCRVREWVCRVREWYTPAGIGNTWSDLRCNACGKIITVQMEDPYPGACPHCARVSQ